jgi:aspartate aminotransferase
LYCLAEAAEKRGLEVYHLNIGQSDLPTPQEFYDEIGNFSKKTLSYAPSTGYTETIKAWQKYFHDFGISFQENQIIVTMGASEALLFAFVAVADYEEEIIVFEPLYPNYLSFASMVDVRLRPVTLNIKNSYHLPPAAKIQEFVNKKTRAILVNNPSNPTGAVYTREELQDVIDLAEKNDLYIIADETYREVIFGKNKFISIMDFPQAKSRTIVVDSVSKRFNLCGARIGCLASQNQEIISSVTKFAQGRLSAPTIEQLGVAPLLADSKKFTDKLKTEYQRRMQTVAQALSQIKGVKYGHPEGAFYLTVELPVNDAEEFCRWLLEKFQYENSTVMLAPGNGFYVTEGMGKKEVRIAYVLESKKLEMAMQILKKALEEFNKKLTI